MGADTQNKRFNSFKITPTPSAALTTNVSVELDETSTTPSGTVDNFKIATKKGKKIKWLLKDIDNEIDALGTVFRRLRVK